MLIGEVAVAVPVDAARRFCWNINGQSGGTRERYASRCIVIARQSVLAVFNSGGSILPTLLSLLCVPRYLSESNTTHIRMPDRACRVYASYVGTSPSGAKNMYGSERRRVSQTRCRHM